MDQNVPFPAPAEVVVGAARLLTGDCRAVLATLPDKSVQCCVTSPPYFNLRNYGHEAQIGLEQTPDAYVAEMVAVFREVRRVLRDDATCWLNIGDSYASNPASGGRSSSAQFHGSPTKEADQHTPQIKYVRPKGYKPKDLLMIPAQVALALRADGWFLRSDIIWQKPCPMPESVTDRPTSAHEHVFLLTKSARYFYDAAAVSEVAVMLPQRRGSINGKGNPGRAAGDNGQPQSRAVRDTPTQDGDGTRNARNVWTIAPTPYRGAHFATMPTTLVDRCIRAGSAPGNVILDPFSGVGTTALVAERLGRRAIGIELNAAYVELAAARLMENLEAMTAGVTPKKRTPRTPAVDQEHIDEQAETQLALFASTTTKNGE